MCRDILIHIYIHVNSHNNKFLVNELISILESESIKNTIYKDLVNVSIKDHELDILLISTLEKLHLANKTNIVFKLAKKLIYHFLVLWVLL